MPVYIYVHAIPACDVYLHVMFTHVVTPSLSYRPLPSSAQPVQQVVPSLTTNGDGESSNSSLPAAGIVYCLLLDKILFCDSIVQ